MKALGMDVDVWSLDGKPTPDGLSGELVCKNPFPNMPVCFLHDEQGKRYFSAYFETIPGPCAVPTSSFLAIERRGLLQDYTRAKC